MISLHVVEPYHALTLMLQFKGKVNVVEVAWQVKRKSSDLLEGFATCSHSSTGQAADFVIDT